MLTRSHAPEPTVHPRPGRRRAPRRRIAFFSPLPPLRSEVSDYSARLLDELKRRYTIDLYHDAGYLPHIGLRSPDFGCYDYRLFERNAGVLDYHALVYQMGNSPYHGYMYETLLRHPGIVTLHDLGLAGFHFWYASGPGWTATPTSGGSSRRSSGRRPTRSCTLAACAEPRGDAGGLHPAGYHLNGRIFEQATAVIVHSPWCVEQVRKPVPGPSRQDVRGRVRGHRAGPFPEQRRAIRARFEMPPEALIIASLGPVHPTKMNAETIAAFAPLARAIPEALLIFVGE